MDEMKNGLIEMFGAASPPCPLS